MAGPKDGVGIEPLSINANNSVCNFDTELTYLYDFIKNWSDQHGARDLF